MGMFKSKVAENMAKVHQVAILETLRGNAKSTLGEILDDLEEDAELKEAFRALSVNDIVAAFDDDEEGDEEEEEEEEVEEAEEEEKEEDKAASSEEGDEEKKAKKVAKKKAPPRVSEKPAKKASKKTAKKASAAKVSDINGMKYNLRTEEGRSQYESAIVTALRKIAEKASMAAVKDMVGGTPAQVRAALNHLIEVGRVDYEGQTRSTRYFLS